VQRGELLAQVEGAVEQVFELGGAVAEVLVAQLVEVEAAAVHVEVLGPVIVAALVGDERARPEVGDAVGTRAERRFERGLREGPRRIERLGEDRQRRHRHRQVAGQLALEREADRVRLGCLGLDHVAERHREARVPLLGVLQRLERENHVGGGDRRAVGELGLGAQPEGNAAPVGSELGRARDEPVDGVRLVERARHEAVEQVLDSLRGVALEDVTVEAVERDAAGGADHGQAATLRRVRVDVLEMREAGRVLEVAEGGEAMALLGLDAGERRRRHESREREYEPARGLLQHAHRHQP
jgi:hypothetical protein